jgi:PEP-CTERM motif
VLGHFSLDPILKGKEHSQGCEGDYNAFAAKLLVDIPSGIWSNKLIDPVKALRMKTVNCVHLGCLALLGTSLVTVPAQTVSVNFDTVGDLINNFNIYQNTSPPVINAATGSPYTRSLTGGVGGSGRVNIATPATGITPDSTAIYKNSSFDFSTAGAMLNVSAYVDIIAPTEAGNRLLHLGFANESTSGLNGNAGLAFMGFRLNPTAIGSTVFAPQWQTKTASGGTANTAGGANLTLTSGDWYQVSVTFKNLGGGNIQGSALVQDFGANGLTAGASSVVSPISLTSADIASDATVWPAFRTFAADGSGGIDNFSASVVVPEPGTTVLVSLGLGTLVFAGRRRRNL